MGTVVAPLQYPTAWPTSPTSPTSDCTVKSQTEMRYTDGVAAGGDCVNGAQYLAERRDLYVERSPIQYTDRLSNPLIMFQGLYDKIVPPSQSKMMRDALRGKGLPVAYAPLQGEQYGFRLAENIKWALAAECYFYSRVSGLDLADSAEPVPIDNL